MSWQTLCVVLGYDARANTLAYRTGIAATDQAYPGCGLLRASGLSGYLPVCDEVPASALERLVITVTDGLGFTTPTGGLFAACRGILGGFGGMIVDYFGDTFAGNPRRSLTTIAAVAIVAGVVCGEGLLRAIRNLMRSRMCDALLEGVQNLLHRRGGPPSGGPPPGGGSTGLLGRGGGPERDGNQQRDSRGDQGTNASRGGGAQSLTWEHLSPTSGHSYRMARAFHEQTRLETPPERYGESRSPQPIGSGPCDTNGCATRAARNSVQENTPPRTGATWSPAGN